MSNYQSPFAVDVLQPENLTGSGGKIYPLKEASVHPTAYVGTDDAGMPIEDTIPPGYWQWWIGISGCLKRVPMRTAAVFSMEPEAERYEMIQTRRMIRDGQMPAWVCPHTLEFKHIKGGALAPGGEDCGGSGDAYKHTIAHPKVCKHMQAVIDKRKAAAKAAHDAAQQQLDRMSVAQAEKMQEQTIKAFGVVMQPLIDQTATRAKLRKGEGDGG